MTDEFELIDQSRMAYDDFLSDADYPPVVSVLCHCHNHEPFIRNTLERIIGQDTDFPVEIIVHDDASSDASPEIIRELAEVHGNRIVALLQKRNQLSQGRRPPHFTFSRAQGEFIALCEGDDYWITSDKLQKQVDALRQHPEVDLCVHPAMCLTMRAGKTRKAFDNGPEERIVSPEAIIARHNQFAPTASIMMRAQPAQKLPSWFFNEPGLPVGDFFIETILGRKGALYLPDTMSVYRRGVPGSYTNTFRKESSEKLEARLARMLYFVEKLRGMEGIPEDALNQRISYVRLNYALQFLAIGDRKRFCQTSRQIHLHGRRGLLAMLSAMRRSRLLFVAGRKAFLQLRRLKG